MKTLHQTLALFLCSFGMIAQQQSQSVNFSTEELSNHIKKDFIKYSTGQESASSSSFAGLDIDKTEFTFSPIYITNNSNVWNAKFKGGVTEGIASFFNNNKFNANMSVDLQYNINLIHEGNIKAIAYLEADYVKFRKDMIEVLKSNLLALKVFVNNDDILKTKGYDVKIDALLGTVLDGDATNKLQANEKKLLALYKSLSKELTDEKNGFTDDRLGAILDVFSLGADKIFAINETRSQAFKFSQYTSKWLTLGANVRNDQFRLLDRTAGFDSQIEKTTYVTYGGKIQYNYFRYNQFGNSFYFTAACIYQNKSNFLELNKIEVVESGTIGNNTTTTRVSNDKYTAYEGEYKKYIDQMNVNLDAYYFVRQFQDIGFHVYENSRFTENLKSQHNIGIGLVFPFKNKEKATTIINAEIYYTLNNIFNTEDTNYGLVERNDIGLRFTFPIDFNVN